MTYCECGRELALDYRGTDTVWAHKEPLRLSEYHYAQPVKKLPRETT